MHAAVCKPLCTTALQLCFIFVYACKASGSDGSVFPHLPQDYHSAPENQIQYIS